MANDALLSMLISVCLSINGSIWRVYDIEEDRLKYNYEGTLSAAWVNLLQQRSCNLHWLCLIHCQYSTTIHISCRCSLLLNCQYLTAIHWACFVPIFFAYTLPIFWYMLCVFLAFTSLPTMYCLYISSNSTYIGNILCSHNISVLCVDGLHNAYSQLLQILDLNIFEDRPCFPQITHEKEDKTRFGWDPDLSSNWWTKSGSSARPGLVPN